MSYIYPTNVYFKRFSSKKVGIFFKKYAYFVNSLRVPYGTLFLCVKRGSVMRLNIYERLVYI